MTLQNQEELLNLWFHENLRVIGDRLVDKTDSEWFDQLLWNVLQDHFKKVTPLQRLRDETLFYGDFCNEFHQYQRITDRTKVLINYKFYLNF